MRSINKISLRMRITLLAGFILVLCSAILTLAASYNAGIQFEELAVTESAHTSQSLMPVSINQELIALENGNYLAVSISPVTAAKKRFDLSSIIILGVVSLFGTGVVYIVAGSSLRPINKLSETVSSITESDLQYRLSEERNDEVGVLAHAFNEMLDRLEKSFLKQKRFSANVAHELKTPLAIINAGIQVLSLEETPSVADCVEILTSTERNVKRLMSVVDDLMRLCDEQEQVIADTNVLQDMFTSICSELKPLYEEKRIETKIDCGTLAIHGNQNLLYRAFFNLVDNAIKYNKHGGKIAIKATSEYEVSKISISDTGYGIPEEELFDIFEPFYRVNKSRSRKTGGAGLGLSIVKMIIEKHGGEIFVDSVLDIGTVFTITLTA